MTVTQIKNFKRRILKARTSFGTMTDMILMFEIDAMSPETAIMLRSRLAELGVSYPYLDAKVDQATVTVEVLGGGQ